MEKKYLQEKYTVIKAEGQNGMLGKKCVPFVTDKS